MAATGYLKQGGLVIPALKFTLKRWIIYSAITSLLLVILSYARSSGDDYSALYTVLVSFGLWALYTPRWFFPYYLAYRQQQHQNRHTVRLEGLSTHDTARFLYRPSLTMRLTPLVCGLVSAILCMQIWSLLGDYQQAGDHDNTWLMLALAVSALVSLAMAVLFLRLWHVALSGPGAIVVGPDTITAPPGFMYVHTEQLRIQSIQQVECSKRTLRISGRGLVLTIRKDGMLNEVEFEKLANLLRIRKFQLSGSTPGW
ncbi:hypothetical protein [Marinobacterium stanieri]|uniref:hypothetical protein n=1 Tax=Marinobacterium stanieri TaxID=49186 RepID=UPI003A91BE7E